MAKKSLENSQRPLSNNIFYSMHLHVLAVTAVLLGCGAGAARGWDTGGAAVRCAAVWRTRAFLCSEAGGAPALLEAAWPDAPTAAPARPFAPAAAPVGGAGAGVCATPAAPVAAEVEAARARLWVLDGGDARCPPQLFVYDLRLNREIWRCPLEGVPVGAARALAVDGEPGPGTGARAYVGDSGRPGGGLAVAALRERRFWFLDLRVPGVAEAEGCEGGGGPVRARALALSRRPAVPLAPPAPQEPTLYIVDPDADRLLALPMAKERARPPPPVHDRRPEAVRAEARCVGRLLGASSGLAADARAGLHYFLRRDLAAVRWDTRRPLAAEAHRVLLQDANVLPGVAQIFLDSQRNVWALVGEEADESNAIVPRSVQSSAGEPPPTSNTHQVQTQDAPPTSNSHQVQTHETAPTANMDQVQTQDTVSTSNTHQVQTQDATPTSNSHQKVQTHDAAPTANTHQVQTQDAALTSNTHHVQTHDETAPKANTDQVQTQDAAPTSNPHQDQTQDTAPTSNTDQVQTHDAAPASATTSSTQHSHSTPHTSPSPLTDSVTAPILSARPARNVSHHTAETQNEITLNSGKSQSNHACSSAQNLGVTSNTALTSTTSSTDELNSRTGSDNQQTTDGKNNKMHINEDGSTGTSSLSISSNNEHISDSKNVQLSHASTTQKYISDSGSNSVHMSSESSENELISQVVCSSQSSNANPNNVDTSVLETSSALPLHSVTNYLNSQEATSEFPPFTPADYKYSPEIYQTTPAVPSITVPKVTPQLTNLHFTSPSPGFAPSLSVEISESETSISAPSGPAASDDCVGLTEETEKTLNSPPERQNDADSFPFYSPFDRPLSPHNTAVNRIPRDHGKTFDENESPKPQGDVVTKFSDNSVSSITNPVSSSDSTNDFIPSFASGIVFIPVTISASDSLPSPLFAATPSSDNPTNEPSFSHEPTAIPIDVDSVTESSIIAPGICTVSLFPFVTEYPPSLTDTYMDENEPTSATTSPISEHFGQLASQPADGSSLVLSSATYPADDPKFRSEGAESYSKVKMPGKTWTIKQDQPETTTLTEKISIEVRGQTRQTQMEIEPKKIFHGNVESRKNLGIVKDINETPREEHIIEISRVEEKENNEMIREIIVTKESERVANQNDRKEMIEKTADSKEMSNDKSTAHEVHHHFENNIELRADVGDKISIKSNPYNDESKISYSKSSDEQSKITDGINTDKNKMTFSLQEATSEKIPYLEQQMKGPLPNASESIENLSYEPENERFEKSILFQPLNENKTNNFEKRTISQSERKDLYVDFLQNLKMTPVAEIFEEVASEFRSEEEFVITEMMEESLFKSEVGNEKENVRECEQDENDEKLRRNGSQKVALLHELDVSIAPSMENCDIESSETESNNVEASVDDVHQEIKIIDSISVGNSVSVDDVSNPQLSTENAPLSNTDATQSSTSDYSEESDSSLHKTVPNLNDDKDTISMVKDFTISDINRFQRSSGGLSNTIIYSDKEDEQSFSQLKNVPRSTLELQEALPKNTNSFLDIECATTGNIFSEDAFLDELRSEESINANTFGPSVIGTTEDTLTTSTDDLYTTAEQKILRDSKEQVSSFSFNDLILDSTQFSNGSASSSEEQNTQAERPTSVSDEKNTVTTEAAINLETPKSASSIEEISTEESTSSPDFLDDSYTTPNPDTGFPTTTVFTTNAKITTNSKNVQDPCSAQREFQYLDSTEDSPASSITEPSQNIESSNAFEEHEFAPIVLTERKNDEATMTGIRRRHRSRSVPQEEMSHFESMYLGEYSSEVNQVEQTTSKQKQLHSEENSPKKFQNKDFKSRSKMTKEIRDSLELLDFSNRQPIVISADSYYTRPQLLQKSSQPIPREVYLHPVSTAEMQSPYRVAYVVSTPLVEMEPPPRPSIVQVPPPAPYVVMHNDPSGMWSTYGQIVGANPMLKRQVESPKLLILRNNKYPAFYGTRAAASSVSLEDNNEYDSKFLRRLRRAAPASPPPPPALPGWRLPPPPAIPSTPPRGLGAPALPSLPPFGLRLGAAARTTSRWKQHCVLLQKFSYLPYDD